MWYLTLEEESFIDTCVDGTHGAWAESRAMEASRAMDQWRPWEARDIITGIAEKIGVPRPRTAE